MLPVLDLTVGRCAEGHRDRLSDHLLEMVRQGTVIGSTYGNYVPALIVIAVLMIAVNFALSAAATRVERRLRRSKRAPEPLEAKAIEQGRRRAR